jgi:ATP-dependent RNA helicase DeaD
MRFNDLQINDKLKETAARQGFDDLTYIQERTMPKIIEGKDVVGQAETGSGKTIAFALPITDKVARGSGLQVLVLTPTRELCVQVTSVFRDFGDPLGLQSISVYGGVGIEPQIKNLKTAEIVVGTPGRILDHMERHTINLSRVRFLILDETDRMLDMGFIDDVESIIRAVPRDRQTLMFSATISFEIEGIMKRHLRDSVIIRTQSQVDPRKLRQFYFDIYYQNDKFPLLVHLLKNATPGLAIVFCATKDETGLVAKNLRKQGVNAMEIHGGMTQNMREKSLDSLKHEHIDVLVATDVAARGLDIKNVTHVYNYDVPNTGKEYIHRIGRTARAGEAGEAITLLTNRDHDNFRRITNEEEELNIVRAEMPHFKRVPFIREPRTYSPRGSFQHKRGRSSGPKFRHRR